MSKDESSSVLEQWPKLLQQWGVLPKGIVVSLPPVRRRMWIKWKMEFEKEFEEFGRLLEAHDEGLRQQAKTLEYLSKDKAEDICRGCWKSSCSDCYLKAKWVSLDAATLKGKETQQK